MTPSTSQSHGNDTLIIALVILASVVIAAIVALAIFGTPDNAVVANATGQIITLVTLISSVLVTLKVTTEAKTAAIESKAVSEENATSLEGVNKKVDGHLGSILLEMKQMARQIAMLEKEKAVTAVETAATIQATAVETAATIQAISANPPPTGTTPPHGTRVVEAPVTVVAPGSVLPQRGDR